MKACASDTCANLIDPTSRVFCSRCKPRQTPEERAADLQAKTATLTNEPTTKEKTNHE